MRVGALKTFTGGYSGSGHVSRGRNERRDMAIKDYVVNTISDLQGVIQDIHRSPDLRLGDILVEERLISREQLNEALVRQRHGKGGKHLVLVDQLHIDQD